MNYLRNRQLNARKVKDAVEEKTLILPAIEEVG